MGLCRSLAQGPCSPSRIDRVMVRVGNRLGGVLASGLGLGLGIGKRL